LILSDVHYLYKTNKTHKCGKKELEEIGFPAPDPLLLLM